MFLGGIVGRVAMTLTEGSQVRNRSVSALKDSLDLFPFGCNLYLRYSFIYFRGYVTLGSQQKVPLAGDSTKMKNLVQNSITKLAIILH